MLRMSVGHTDMYRYNSYIRRPILYNLYLVCLCSARLSTPRYAHDPFPVYITVSYESTNIDHASPFYIHRYFFGIRSLRRLYTT